MENIQKSYRQYYLLNDILEEKLSKGDGIHHKIPPRYFYIVSVDRL
jgi:hypothetical protein